MVGLSSPSPSAIVGVSCLVEVRNIQQFRTVQLLPRVPGHPGSSCAQLGIHCVATCGLFKVRRTIIKDVVKRRLRDRVGTTDGISAPTTMSRMVPEQAAVGVVGPLADHPAVTCAVVVAKLGLHKVLGSIPSLLFCWSETAPHSPFTAGFRGQQRVAPHTRGVLPPPAGVRGRLDLNDTANPKNRLVNDFS